MSVPSFLPASFPVPEKITQICIHLQSSGTPSNNCKDAVCWTEAFMADDWHLVQNHSPCGAGKCVMMQHHLNTATLRNASRYQMQQL